MDSVDTISSLIDCDLGESALQLAELSCRPLLQDPSVAAAERLRLARSYAAALRAQQQPRAALRALADFAASARGQLSAADVEGVARDLAALRWILGEADVCVAQLRQIPRAHRTAHDWARMARAAAALGHAAEAREFYAHVVKAQPNAAEALSFCCESPGDVGESDAGLVALAGAAAMMRRLAYADAAAALRRVARRFPGLAARALAMQATCHFELGAAERARKMFAQAAAIDPPLVDGLAAYAGTLARLGDRLALYALGRRLLAGDAGRAEGWVAMARFLLLSGRVSEALAVAWKAQAASPRLPDAFLAEGEAQMAAGAPADAVAALERAHAIAPSAQTYAALVAALVAAGRVKDAFV
ncbi:hypothetical protein GGI21_006120, partial [Coemansia aciculifera]